MSPQGAKSSQPVALIRADPKAAMIVVVCLCRSNVSEGNIMPVFKLPLSGDVVQSIYPSFFSPAGGQFGLINITVGQSSAPEVEKDVLSDVAGYGKQIGRVADALLAVIEHLEVHDGRGLEQDKAIIAFKELMHSVAAVKERHGRTASRPKRR
ncbi:hypothetical protein [Bradyrhizobium guangdongense]|nr:hypothetical protein [Bradyrhizobium guangdongense]